MSSFLSRFGGGGRAPAPDASLDPREIGAVNEEDALEDAAAHEQIEELEAGAFEGLSNVQMQFFYVSSGNETSGDESPYSAQYLASFAPLQGPKYNAEVALSGLDANLADLERKVEEKDDIITQNISVLRKAGHKRYDEDALKSLLSNDKRAVADASRAILEAETSSQKYKAIVAKKEEVRKDVLQVCRRGK